MDLFLHNPPPGENIPKPRVLSVFELTRKIKILLEGNFISVMVRGEISNVTRHSSGHIYFTLKDEQAQIRCVTWRSTVPSLLVDVREGIKVIAQGKIAVYEKGGYYQIVATQLHPEGLGELQLALERLKQKLFKEGLFDASHKQPLPPYPATVGIITSPTGAAIRDIISIARRRNPAVRLILAPVKVQGEGAAEDIVRALKDFAEYGKVDVIILGRGGGSIEDLWAFNEEIVARAIYDSPIPVVSAVGHEIDYTIADLVADVRAATPSAAAEQVVPSADDMRQYLTNIEYTLVHHVRKKLELLRMTVRQIQNRYAFRQPESVVAQYRQQTDDLERRLIQSAGFHLKLRRQTWEGLHKRLMILNPENTLKRGYTMILQDDGIVDSAGQLKQKPAVIRFYDGEADADIRGIVRKK